MPSRAKSRSRARSKLVPALVCALFAFLLTPSSALAGFGFQFKWGSSGASNGQFSLPSDVAVGNNNNVYIADQGNNRIQRFTFDTTFLGRWGANGGDGTSGTAEGQFNNPYGIAAAGNGDIYVTDADNHRVQKFTSQGTFVSAWGWGVADGGPQFEVCTAFCRAGSPGTGDGQFDFPSGITVHGSDVYVTDRVVKRVQKFNTSGTFSAKWSSWSGPGQAFFSSPVGVAVDSGGAIYVTDFDQNRVVKFQGSNRTYMTEWGTASGTGQLSSPLGLAIDASDNVYVAGYGNNKVQEFTTSGTFIAAGGSAGSGDGQFSNPAGLDTDPTAGVYVADSGNHRIQFGTITESGTTDINATTLRYIAGSGTPDNVTISYIASDSDFGGSPSYKVSNVGNGASISPNADCGVDPGDPSAVKCQDTGINAIDVELRDQNDAVTISDSIPNAVDATIDGGTGNDILRGGGEDDVFDGGGGTDTVDFAGAASSINANLATGIATGDSVFSDGLINIDNLTGSPGIDTLTGDGNPNVIRGGTGADILAGGVGGGDTVDYSDAGSSVNVTINGTVSGGAGADSLSGFENVTGSSHNDTLTGDASANVIKGANGVDAINGGDGTDTLEGDAGNDGLTGGNNTDTADYTGATSSVTVSLAAGTASGGADDDTLATVENVTGGSHGDSLIGDGGANTFDGAAGDDTVDYSGAGSAVTANLSNGTTSGGGGTDTLVNVEGLIGSASGDTLTGDTGPNTLNGAGGDDTLDGGSGTDTLAGGTLGETNGDTVTYAAFGSALTVDLSSSTPQNTGVAGSDTLTGLENVTGGSGDDLLTGTNGNNAIDGGGGSDTAGYSNAASGVTATVNGAATGGGGTDALTSIENLTGSPFGDTLTGDAGANVLSGTSGGDQLLGAGGADTLDGGANDDLMRGSAGDDSLNGGIGGDTVDYSDASSNVTVNLASSSAQSTGGAGTDTISNTENVTGSPQNDTLTGNDAINHLDGGDGGDEIHARDFTADIVDCGNGDDFAEADFSDQLTACESTSIASPPSSGGVGNGAPDSSPPSISGLAAGKISARVGGPFNFTLSETATVAFTIDKQELGRKVRRSCKRQTKKNRKKKVCRYYKSIGSVNAPGNAGVNAFKFSGKLNSKPLKVGPYRLTAVPTDAAGNKGTPVTVLFAVLR